MTDAERRARRALPSSAKAARVSGVERASRVWDRIRASRWGWSLGWLSRLALGGAFVTAGVIKLSDSAAFVEQIGNYQLFPEWAAYLGVMLPGVEVVAGAAVIAAPPSVRQAAQWLVLAMLLAFSSAVGRAWLLGIDVECGCFGTGSSPIGFAVIARNLGLIAMTVLLLWLDAPPASGSGRRPAAGSAANPAAV